MARRSALVMTGIVTLVLLALFTVVACTPDSARATTPARATTLPEACITGTQQSGSDFLICVPGDGDQPWNGDLLLYAHGYMSIDRPIGIPEEQMVLPGPTGPVAVNELVTSLGYGFATTSYPTNGLAVLPAITDLIDLVDLFTAHAARPRNVLLAGVSEGGLITTLAIEGHPEVFDGGLAMCGPYGGFSEQVNHFGDFRIVFDYFFPGLMPGEPVTIPTWLTNEEWSTTYFSTTILPKITAPANALSVTQLLSVTYASPYVFDPPTSTTVIEKLLWYNVVATEDAKQKLGGQPFDNVPRVYSGSDDDAALNAGVARIAADPSVLAEMTRTYRTTGHLMRPLVTLHNTGDFVVPYWHVPLYQQKVTDASSEQLYRHFVSGNPHGHCEFNALEVLAAFDALVKLIPHRIFLPLIVH
jgi:pimeloyl-ACP methyl ester carboxylesterase